MDERITRNILEQEPPPTTDFVNRVRFCAKALAYGAANGLWEPRIHVDLQQNWYQYGRNIYTSTFKEYFYGVDEENKLLGSFCWDGDHPKISFLEAFNYVKFVDSNKPKSSEILPAYTSYHDIYLLTPQAFQLLETPLTPPKVFISYRRGVSTVLGLLIEARLKTLSDELNPYIDKELEVGKPWEVQLKKRVEACDTFISLIGSKDSFSKNVLNEIRWAKEANKKIISIWHGEFTNIEPHLCPDTELANYLGDNHGIAVKGAQAIDYETAIILLENELHYF